VDRVGRAENENTFRLINENVEQLAGEENALDFLCECSRLDCTERIRLAVDDYRRVRQVPERFILKHGHEQPDIERVVEVERDYLIVEKVGEAGRVAREGDPNT
jgi:hypothetical protein